MRDLNFLDCITLGVCIVSPIHRDEVAFDRTSGIPWPRSLQQVLTSKRTEGS